MRNACILLVALSACVSPRSEVTFDQAGRDSATVEVQSAVRGYVAALGPARCTDPDPFYAFWTYEYGGVLLAEDNRVARYDATGHREVNRPWFCSIRRQELVLDSIVIQPLSRDAAISVWAFHEVAVDTAGVRSAVRGVVQQPWVRSDRRWLSTGLMSTHEIVP